jgi:hypothetical protein
MIRIISDSLSSLYFPFFLEKPSEKIFATALFRPYTGYVLVYGIPLGKSPDVLVINVYVSDHLHRCSDPICEKRTGRFVGIDGIELKSPLFAELDSVLKKFPVTGSPENEFMSLESKLLVSLNGKRLFFSDFRILVLDNRPVKIYRNSHYRVLINGY